MRDRENSADGEAGLSRVPRAALVLWARPLQLRYPCQHGTRIEVLHIGTPAISA